MNELWNLNPIYTGFDSPEFAEDMAELKKTAKEFALFAETKLNKDSSSDAKLLHDGIIYLEKLTVLTEKLAVFSSLVQSADTKNSEASSRLGNIMAVYSSIAGPMSVFQKYVSEISDDRLQEYMSADPLIGSYSYMLSRIKTDSKYLLESKCEEIMARMSLSGSNAWSDLQSYLTSTVTAEYDGKILNLSSVRNLAYDPDEKVRKAAYEAEIACYDKIKDAVAFALNSIKLETINDTQLRGYESPLDRTLINSAMKKETLDAMLEAMVEYMPAFRKYLKAKGRALGHNDGIPFYDLFAPMGRNTKTYTTEEAKEYLLNIFGKFDKELHDMVKRAFDEEWIDFYPRDGKTGGAFCASVDSIGQSRILTNFDGSFSDIVTLAHELGHAFHNQCIKTHRALNRDYSMPVAETASTFNECVVMSAAIKAAEDKDQKLALIESRLMDLTQIIVDIYSRFCFEAEVFEKREENFLSAATLCEMMLEAQKKSYGDGLCADCMHPYMWVCKSHYYGPTFYNFPYAFGGLFARGLYAQYEAEGDKFIDKYKRLLHTTPVATVEDAALIAEIDLTDKNFWRLGLQQAANEIEEFIKLIEE